MTVAEKLREEGRKEELVKISLKLLNNKFHGLSKEYQEKLNFG
ncbi:MAG: hypothetical protein ACQEQF_12635 [Bacillota bacterium]